MTTEYTNISDLVSEYGSLNKIIELLQNYKLEAHVVNYEIEIDGDLLDCDFLIRTDSIFVENPEQLTLDSILVVDLSSYKEFETFELHEDREVRCRDIYITNHSLDENRKYKDNKYFLPNISMEVTLIRMKTIDDNYSSFRKLKIDEKVYVLSKEQAKVIWFMSKMKLNGQIEVETVDILQFIKAVRWDSKLRDVFRAGSGMIVFNSLMLPGSKRGKWKLSEKFSREFE